MKCLPLILLALTACHGPDEVSVSPWYGTGQSTWSGEGRDFSSHTSGAMLTMTWALGERARAFEALTLIAEERKLERAAKLALHEDHGPAPLPVPIIIPISTNPPGPAPGPSPEPVPPGWDWSAPFKKVPETLEEMLLFGIYLMILIGVLVALVRAVLALKRGGVLEMLPFFKKNSDK